MCAIVGLGDRRPRPARSARVEEEIERAWADLLATWDDDRAHERVVALADAADRLPLVAQRYRSVADAGGERAARARTALELITTRALGRMASTPRSEIPARRPVEWIALGLSVALGAAALWQILRVM